MHLLLREGNVQGTVTKLSFLYFFLVKCKVLLNNVVLYMAVPVRSHTEICWKPDQFVHCPPLTLGDVFLS